MTVIRLLAFMYENENKNEKSEICLCKLDLTLGFLLAHVYIRSRSSLARLEPLLRAVDRVLVTLSSCIRSRACDLVFVPMF